MFATASYSMGAIQSHSLVSAYHDLGSGGQFWVALPDAFQFDSLVVVTTGYTYAAGQFSLTLASSSPTSTQAVATVMDGYQIKVVVVP